MLFDAGIDTFTDATGVLTSSDGGLTFQPIIASGTDFDHTIVVEDILDRTNCNAWKIAGFAGATFVGGGTVPDQQGAIT